MLEEAEDGVFGKARVTAMFNTLRRALLKYWQMARGLFAGDNSQLNDMTLEDFADMAMGDMLHKVNPAEEAKSDNNVEPSFSIAPEEDAAYLDAVEKGDEKKTAEMVSEAARRAMPDT